MMDANELIHRYAKQIYRDECKRVGEHRMEVYEEYLPIVLKASLEAIEFATSRHLTCECGYKETLGPKRPRPKKHKPSKGG